MRTKAIPVSGGRLLINSLVASMPPADAPMATIMLSLGSCWGAAWWDLPADCNLPPLLVADFRLMAFLDQDLRRGDWVCSEEDLRPQRSNRGKGLARAFLPGEWRASAHCSGVRFA